MEKQEKVKAPITSKQGCDVNDSNWLSSFHNDHKIDIDSVKTFILGTSINSINSTFNNNPIFNLMNLKIDGLLDLNPQSASKEYTSIQITSNKSAATSSSSVDWTIKGSANIAGVIGLSGAIHNEQSSSFSHSDGKIYVSMQRGKYDSYYEIKADDLIEGYNLCPYLIGTELDDTTVSKYISYTEEEYEGEKYIDNLNFGGYAESGLILWSDRNIYGNIQLLTRMEEIFDILLKQYRHFENNPKIHPIILSNLIILKSKIGNVVRDFYKHIGTHFIKKLYFANYAYGFGELRFNESSGNQESQFGVAISANGGVPTKVSISQGESVNYIRQKGWASAMRDLTIEAYSEPANIIDIGGFANEIKSNLNDQDKSLQVPDLTIPKAPVIEILDIPVVTKKKIGPPDSVFSSYSDWKEYQTDIKKDKEGNNKVSKTIDDSDEEVNRESVDILRITDEQTVPKRNENKINKHTQYLQESTFFQNQNKNKSNASKKNDQQHLRIDDMFVSGYETETYEYVIPSLRINKIVLPEGSLEIETYPNSTKILLVINLFRQLTEYLQFINNFTISNTPPSLYVNLNDFYNQFSDEGNKLVTHHMATGKDVEEDHMNDFAELMYGENDSRLIQALDNDIDHYNYVMYLLKPNVMHLWRDAPGGYAPFFFTKKPVFNGKLCFVQLDQIVSKRDEPGEPIKSYLNFNLTELIKDTPDISKLYSGRNESPLFPIFRYESRHEPKLLFLQLAGRYQLIYGKNGLIQPFLQMGKHYILFLTQDNIINNDIADTDEHVINKIIDKLSGFEISKINNKCALYFPDKTQTKKLREDYRVIMPSFDWDQGFSQTIAVSHRTGYHADYGILLQDISTSLKSLHSNMGNVAEVEDGRLHSSQFFPVLLPINHSKVKKGYGPLLMGNGFGAKDFVGNPTYNCAVRTSIKQEN